MGIYFAQQGGLLGPILALLVYNLPHLLCRWYGLQARLPGGTTDLADENLPKRPYGPGDLYRINCWPHGRRRDDRQHDRYHHPARFTAGQTTMKAQEFIEKILPSLLPLLFAAGMLVDPQGVNINWILQEPSRSAWRPARWPALRRGISPMHAEGYMNETPACLLAMLAILGDLWQAAR